ncbi:MAG TPA: hypothetical protein VF270_01190, partial [Ignavibacteriaceae bacterium]
MKISKNIFAFVLILIALSLNSNILFAQGGNNNAFVFNGSTSQLYVYDNAPANSDANQDGFKYFNSNAANN